MPPTYLDRIVTAHRARAAADDRGLDRLMSEAAACAPTRGFRAALARAAGELRVIAEIKRRSPSKGDLARDLDPAGLATAYVEGGAACLSVLTDEEWFGGSPHDLAMARAAVDVPVLRKDFTVDARDVCDARLMGADAVLLIAAVLDDDALAGCLAVAASVELDALVEVHDEDELARALAAGAGLIGVNQRDLSTFEVDRSRAVRVGAVIPEGVVRVAESGVGGRADAEALAAAGFHAVLVGEMLVRSGDPAGGVRELRVRVDV